MAETMQIPPGYMQDPQGRLVPESMVKEIDKMRNDLVHSIIKIARETSEILAVFKNSAFSDIQSFCELSAEQYKKDMGGIKGNVTLLSFDGRYKVSRAVSETYVFDERLQVAKSLVDDCLQEWSGDSRPELKMLINDAFQVDKLGQVNVKRIMSLRKFNIDDPRWKKAMEAINDSLNVLESRVYLRVHERIGNTDQWKQIPLDIAGV
ncbi:MAG: DUF3164 family protein [Desulfocapsaceae bacterium]|nr:DUF3164 family protein [Desulfocapsaceae bacterium]